jgi:hypothetical protein
MLIIDLDGRSGGSAEDIAGEREGSDCLQASAVDGDGEIPSPKAEAASTTSVPSSMLVGPL